MVLAGHSPLCAWRSFGDGTRSPKACYELMVSVHSHSVQVRRQSRSSDLNRSAWQARRKFLSVFPKGFYDADYMELERDYKWAAHLAWEQHLSKSRFAAMIKKGSFAEIASQAVRIE